jgi:hypothetical protein
MARRSLKPLELSRGTRRPSGPRWDAWRALLVRGWWGRQVPCYYCGHRFRGPQLIEAAHLISPIVAPEKAFHRDNLVPAHGGGRRRCPEKECNLACNYLAHTAPDAPRDENGADLPFTPQFLARATAARAQFLGKNGKNGARREIPLQFPEKWPGAGRSW